MTSKYDIYDVVRSKLNQMFFIAPDIKIRNWGVEFRLDGADAKMVTTATMKRWIKEANITADCHRDRIVGWNGPTGEYECRIVAQ